MFQNALRKVPLMRGLIITFHDTNPLILIVWLAEPWLHVAFAAGGAFTATKYKEWEVRILPCSPPEVIGRAFVRLMLQSEPLHFESHSLRVTICSLGDIVSTSDERIWRCAHMAETFTLSTAIDLVSSRFVASIDTSLSITPLCAHSLRSTASRFSTHIRESNPSRPSGALGGNQRFYL